MIFCVCSASLTIFRIYFDYFLKVEIFCHFDEIRTSNHEKRVSDGLNDFFMWYLKDFHDFSTTFSTIFKRIRPKIMKIFENFHFFGGEIFSEKIMRNHGKYFFSAKSFLKVAQTLLTLRKHIGTI